MRVIFKIGYPVGNEASFTNDFFQACLLEELSFFYIASRYLSKIEKDNKTYRK